MNLSGNTIFIAGATSGIGRGLAERFADAGNHVIIAGPRQHLVDEIVAGHDNIEGLVPRCERRSVYRGGCIDHQDNVPRG
jgi:short-subunit dehydrogenase involved in D-alanine esterification of teichoic acids